MPSVLERFNRSPAHEQQAPLRIELGEAVTVENNGDQLFSNHDSNVYGMVSPSQDNEWDRITAELVAPVLDRELSNNFDAEVPEQSLRQAFDRAQEEIEQKARKDVPDFATIVSVAAVKFYRHEDKTMLAYGTIGQQSVYRISSGRVAIVNDEELSRNRESAHGIGMPHSVYNPTHFGVCEVAGGEVIIIQNPAAGGKSEAEMMSLEEIDELGKGDDLDQMAIAAAERNKHYENRAAMVLRVAESTEQSFDLVSRRSRMSQRIKGILPWKRSSEEADTTENRHRRRFLGGATLAGAGAATGVTAQPDDTIRDRPVLMRPPKVERRGGNVIVDQEKQESRRRGGAKRAILLGALAVGSVLALRYGVDLGDDISNWVGDRPDTGVDVWPFGDGDIDDGNGNGWDLNPTNENLDRNDDPVNESFVDTGGVDLLPPFFDGDWFSLNSADVDGQNLGSEPSTDIDGDLDVDAPEPEPEAPEVEAPDVDPVVPPAPPVWTPDMFTIENGNGLVQEIHQLGHEIVGYNNFNTPDAVQVYEAVKAQYGDSFLELTDHAGADLYHHGDELRISAPGQAHWASQEIEHFVHEKIREMAAA